MKRGVILLGVLLAWTAVGHTENIQRDETGTAACYSKKLVGHKTTSGDKYDPNQLTMGHASFPMGTKVKITNLKNKLSVVAVVNDHMSAHAGGRRHHIIADVSQEVCRQLDFPKGGEAKVSLEAQQ